MLNKTKAALQSCQCHYQVFNQEQNTRISAGGQSLSELHNHNSVLVGFSSNRGEVSKTYIRQWRTLAHTAKNYPDIGWYHSLSASLACLRWRRLISPLIEATTKPAVLSPSSFTFSSSPINSNGTLETICCDLLFLEPVAMSAFPFDWWHSVYAKINHNQGLKVAFTLFYGKCMPPVKVKHKWQRPGVLGTTTEASNQTVIRGNDHG
ncbi:hypothetical protein SFB9_1007 [Klebsiella michiganensis]|nr:hypothetical protein SFB9_1007 [Klebsiella michiganensis]